jgi:UPF0288 family protein (methanogenesis marker protein 3)
MLESLKSGDTIIPIFHNLKPGALRWTNNKDQGYGIGLHELKVETDKVTIKKWREVLSIVFNISGFTLEAYIR